MSAGDAVAALFDQYARRLHALASRVCGNAADAEDLVQEVFLQAFRRWDTFRGDADPGTWLHTIAVRSCRARRKGGTDRRVPPVSQLLPWDESQVLRAAAAPDRATADLLRNEAIATVQRAVTELPEHLRMPLLLKEVLGLSVIDTAEALGLAENTVKTRIHRARLALRKAMTSGSPGVDAPAPLYDRQVCLDLLKAKLAAMDRGDQRFAVPAAEVCARCRAVFRELDLVQDACMQLGQGEIPTGLRQRILDAVDQRDQGAARAGVRRGRKPVRAAPRRR